jgi:hypothetical protein
MTHAFPKCLLVVLSNNVVAAYKLQCISKIAWESLKAFGKFLRNSAVPSQQVSKEFLEFTESHDFGLADKCSLLEH